MQMHPAMILLLSVLLRIAALWLAGGRILGLSLAGGSNIAWLHVPALALLYFSFSPKPMTGAWRFVTMSALFYMAGVWVLIVERTQWRNGIAIEVGLLTILFATHLAYALWKKRDENWGRWARV